MNKVYSKENAKRTMNIRELTLAADFRDRHDELIEYDMKRLDGNLCDCNGNGAFILLPEDDEAVIEGGKRYMVCRKCGGHSHL